MPHKCVRCGKIYTGKSNEPFRGCTCGSRVFLYLRADNTKANEESVKILESKKVHEKDIEWIDREFGDILAKSEGTIHLDIENVARINEGKFQFDLESLLSGQPIVIKARDGVYYIDIPYAMRPKKNR